MALKEHFKNLDGLRFFAAVFVVINHTESMKDVFKLPSLHRYTFFQESGTLAVKFFFVLSGFLITYLLLQEKNEKEAQSKNISVVNFYKKRILRIWPLYYTLIFSTFFLFPFIPILRYDGYQQNFFIHHKESFFFYLFFMPNLAFQLFGVIIYLGQLWSLSVEEFFYLVFPWFIFLNQRRNLLKVTLISLVVFFIVSVSLIEYIRYTPSLQHSLFFMFLSLYQIHIFLFGSLAAIAYSHFKNHVFIIKHSQLFKYASNLLLILSFLLVLFSSHLKDSQLKLLFYPFLFTILIFILCVSKVNIYILNNKVVLYLGKLSFGIYMLHPIAITLCIKTISKIGVENFYTSTIFFDVASLLLAIAFASFSYTFIERPFLRLRNK